MSADNQSQSDASLPAAQIMKLSPNMGINLWRLLRLTFEKLKLRQSYERLKQNVKYKVFIWPSITRPCKISVKGKKPEAWITRPNIQQIGVHDPGLDLVKIFGSIHCRNCYTYTGGSKLCRTFAARIPKLLVCHSLHNVHRNMPVAFSDYCSTHTLVSCI